MATTNPFSLLDSDDEQTPKQQQPKTTTKKPVVTKKPTKKVVNNNTKRAGGNNNQGSDFNAGGKEQRRPKGGRDNHRRNQGRNKREYDRRSGTGFGKEIKKDGAGSRNWGKPGDEVKTDVVADNEEEVVVEAEEEDQTPELTMEDFEALRLEKRQGEAFQELAVRKGNSEIEGVAYTKKESEEGTFLQMGGKKEKRVRDRKFEKELVLDVGFKVQNSAPQFENDRGNRSSRGRKGGRGRGRGRSNRGRGPAINALDASAFPALGN